jgi:GAF domain-containing protein
VISSDTTSPTTPWRDRTLCRLVDDVRSLLPAAAVSFTTLAREGRDVADVTGWFGSDELRDALCASGASGPVEAALERSRPLLLPRVDAWQVAPLLCQGLVNALGETRGRRAWAAYRSCSLIACPIRSDLDRTLGVLVIVSDDAAERLRSEHLRTVEVLASLAALALDRADLLEAEAARGREEARLNRAAETLSASLEPVEVYERVAEQAATVTGATRALLTRINSRTGELRTEASVDFSDGLADRIASIGSGSFGEVARTRRPLLRRAGEAGGTDAGLLAEAGIGSLLHAPIELGPRLYGVLTVAHPEPGFLDEQSLEQLTKLARAAAAAIANAIDFERERRIARALTLGFVPGPLPELPGYDTGLLYSPAANEPTGGDVYGAWPVGDGRQMAVLVGDVAGKGVETAALSSMVRFFVEARSWDSLSPAAVLEQTNRMLLGRLPRDTFVTAFVGVLSHESLRYCNAGHLPPLRVRDGRAEPLDLHGLPLGVDDVRSYSESDLSLAGGDLVFAYTDGLVEARRDGEVYGQERLAAMVARLAGTHAPAELVAAMHEEVAAWGDGLDDDAVALALRRAT